VNSGNLPLFQANLPESTMTPPMLVPWPPMYFVAEATMMSTPCSIGATRPIPTVLSTMKGTPAAWAILAIASKSGTSSFGLPIVSA
jgi:hypothetical protein